MSGNTQTTGSMDTSVRAIVIGTSTGGPAAILEMLRALPEDLSVPIFVAQHMEAEFIPEFVRSLSRDIHMPVVLSAQNEEVFTGHIYVMPAGSDAKAIRDPLGRQRIVLMSPSALLKPSIDVLMASVATVYGTHCLGVALTCMGSDGLEGMRAIKSAGGHTFVQDEATSAVYGMAQAVDNEHLADTVLPLPAIAGAVLSWSTSP